VPERVKRFVADRPPSKGSPYRWGADVPSWPYLLLRSGLCRDVHFLSLTPGILSVLNSSPSPSLERTSSTDGPSVIVSKISVIVVAAERLFGQGLARLLGEDEGLDVIAVSDGEPELVELCTATSANVVLIWNFHAPMGSTSCAFLPRNAPTRGLWS